MDILGPNENFLAIEDKSKYQYDSAHYVIQSIPYEHTSSYVTGSAKGPAAILEASHYVEFYDEELRYNATQHRGIASLKELDLKSKVDEEALELVRQATSEHLRKGKFVITLGAEHTVTFGLLKAHLDHYENVSVLQIDAHSDLRESYNNNKYSHASVMARVHELGVKIAQVGIRAQDQREAELIQVSNSIHTTYAHQVNSGDEWQEKTLNFLSDNVYLTIDADGFDPSVTPAVGTPEPGGLLWQNTLNFLRKVINNKNVIGFDIVEIAPKDGEVITEYSMAKLCYKLICSHSMKTQSP